MESEAVAFSLGLASLAVALLTRSHTPTHCIRMNTNNHDNDGSLDQADITRDMNL